MTAASTFNPSGSMCFSDPSFAPGGKAVDYGGLNYSSEVWDRQTYHLEMKAKFVQLSVFIYALVGVQSMTSHKDSAQIDDDGYSSTEYT